MRLAEPLNIICSTKKYAFVCMDSKKNSKKKNLDHSNVIRQKYFVNKGQISEEFSRKCTV